MPGCPLSGSWRCPGCPWGGEPGAGTVHQTAVTQPRAGDGKSLCKQCRGLRHWLLRLRCGVGWCDMQGPWAPDPRGGSIAAGWPAHSQAIVICSYLLLPPRGWAGDSDKAWWAGMADQLASLLHPWARAPQPKPSPADRPPRWPHQGPCPDGLWSGNSRVTHNVYANPRNPCM